MRKFGEGSEQRDGIAGLSGLPVKVAVDILPLFSRLIG
jgi:hypothetical protein